MPSIPKLLFPLTLGVALGAAIMKFIIPSNVSESTDTESQTQQPLYWVAPMDANYRRDKPGLSPMGMDLIPVYEDAETLGGNDSGAVKIAPHVVNNLGVRTAPVQIKSMNTDISTVGYIQFDEDKLVHIHPRVEGWIEKLFIKAAGNPVEKGQALYTLYSPQLVNAQEEFLIALKRNNTTLISAAKERLAALQLSTAFIEELEQTRKVKQTITFFARQSGVVDGLKVREGFYVKPGNTLMSIGQLEQVWAEAEVFERDAALVKAGLPVSMTLDYLPAEKWSGVVDYVYPTLNAKNRTLRVRLKFDNPNLSLKPNMFAQVTIHINSDQPVMMVPKESVIRTGKQDRVVLALGDGRFKSVAVTIGRVNSTNIEVLAGLNEADVVVTSAQFLIDSESSKSADFTRMSQHESADTVWVQGMVNHAMVGHRMVNISHEPIKAWNWPEMTMDFSVAEGVDMNAFRQQQPFMFELKKIGDSGYQVIDITEVDASLTEQEGRTVQTEVPVATVNGVINSIDMDNRVLNISRDAIEKWGRDAATMNFIAADNLDLHAFHQGQAVTFTFEVRDDLYIVEIAPKTMSSASAHAAHVNNG